jgi:hypothetical protein
MQAYEASGTNSAAGGWSGSADRGVAIPVAPRLHALWLAAWPAACLLVLGLAGLVAATLMPTGQGGDYAVIAPPWYTLPQTIALVRQAQGAIAQTGTADNIVIAHARRAGFVRALYRGGAWLVVDPLHVRGCAGFAPVSGGMR